MALKIMFHKANDNDFFVVAYLKFHQRFVLKPNTIASSIKYIKNIQQNTHISLSRLLYQYIPLESVQSKFHILSENSFDDTPWKAHSDDSHFFHVVFIAQFPSTNTFKSPQYYCVVFPWKIYQLIVQHFSYLLEMKFREKLRGKECTEIIFPV